MLIVNSYSGSQAAGPLRAAISCSAGAARREANSRGAGEVSSADQPLLVIFSPFRVMRRYSTPGSVAASRSLSAGVRTDIAVASAPAVAGDSATTVELMI